MSNIPTVLFSCTVLFWFSGLYFLIMYCSHLGDVGYDRLWYACGAKESQLWNLILNAIISANKQCEGESWGHTVKYGLDWARKTRTEFGLSPRFTNRRLSPGFTNRRLSPWFIQDLYNWLSDSENITGRLIESRFTVWLPLLIYSFIHIYGSAI